MWWSLEHKNILPFLGYCSDFGDSVALISPYISGGDLLNFLIKRAPKSEDRLSLVCSPAKVCVLYSNRLNYTLFHRSPASQRDWIICMAMISLMVTLNAPMYW